MKRAQLPLHFLIVIFMANLNIANCQTSENLDKNMLSTITTDNLNDFKWINEPDSFTVENGVLIVKADKGTDFFNNPMGTEVNGTAPLLYQEIEGDFVTVAVVKPDFSSMWNAVSIMVYQDSLHWIKFAFENSDATGKSIVTVITNNRSDDANGVILEDYDKVWLRMVRKDKVYSMQWSLDGKDYKMARIGLLPAVDKVKVGIEVQCPVGESATHEIVYFNIENKTVEDLRKGE